MKFLFCPQVFGIWVLLTLLGFPNLLMAQGVIALQLEGNLKSDRAVPLKSFDEATSKDSPVDLFTLAREMIGRGEYEQASKALFVGSIYGAFDGLRVSDPTARQAMPVLMMGVGEGLSEKKKDEFFTYAQDFNKDPKRLREILNKIGPPTYHPRYMINHGIAAFKSPLKNQSNGSMGEGGVIKPTSEEDSGLISDFDPQLAWESILKSLER